MPSRCLVGVESDWRTPPDVPALGVTDVHVWRASVAAHAAKAQELRALLDLDEQARADRFHYAQDRVQYIASHAVLRTLLARYTGGKPEALRFTTGACGKPYLRGLHGRSPLEFNLSHSGDCILLAVSLERAVGVDVERWVEGVEYDDLAERFFSDGERRTLRSLPPGAKSAAFFACWSRKEAYIKATGLGVSRGLDYFDVSLAPGTPAELLADRLAPHAVSRWRMHDLIAAPGYSGAVIADGPDCRFERLIFSLQPEGVRT